MLSKWRPAWPPREARNRSCKTSSSKSPRTGQCLWAPILKWVFGSRCEGFTVAAPGTVVLPRDRFGKILSESSDENLDLESDGGKVLVRGQRSEFQLPSQNPDEFPSVVVFEEQKYHEMPARFFREVVRRTVFATDNESSRYALGGVLIEFSTSGLTAVATDGRRLARQEGPAQSVGGHVSGDNMTIIPTRPCNCSNGPWPTTKRTFRWLPARTT